MSILADRNTKVSGGQSTAEEKIAAMEAVGIKVAASTSELGSILLNGLGRKHPAI